MPALLLSLLLASPALDGARASLAAGKLDEVLFALQPAAAVPKEEAKDAAAVLVETGRLATARGDKPLALSLVQTALKKDSVNGPALELLGSWSLAESEFNLAIAYARRWVAADPQSAQAREFLARAEERERTWTPPDYQPPKEKKHRRKRSRKTSQAGAQVKAAPPAGRVTLYASASCQGCKKARKWLAEQRIPYAEVDVEHDAKGARELNQKRIRSRVPGEALPVLDVNGVLIDGFSARAVEAALARQ